MPRITWPDLPDAVRAEVETILGAPVVAHASHPGGFSPGTADRVTCADGAAAFVKAVHPYLNPDSPDIHRAELRVMRALPAGLPVPALLGGFERDGWVVLVMEYVEADHPTLPWTRESFTPVVDAVLGLSDRLTPSPLELQPASGHCAGMWAGYARCLVQPPDDLDPWVRARLPALAERADVSLAVLDGDTLTHFDLRADNLLLRRGDAPPADRVVVIDWPWAMAGARWADATTMTLELAAQGDPESIRATDDVLERIAAHCGVTTEPLVDTTVGLAGFFTWQCRTPDPPGLPTLRAFQRSLAEGLTAWLKGTRLATW
ncbi:MAG: phosphotransferase [Propioniciclava sp.]|nr:phosphotransferase [Propioniciclava sp.]